MGSSEGRTKGGFVCYRVSSVLMVFWSVVGSCNSFQKRTEHLRALIPSLAHQSSQNQNDIELRN